MQLVAETERLLLRRPSTGDAPFFHQLVNQPSWLRFIGDHGVRNLHDAVDYIIDGPQAMYAEHGFALTVCESRADGRALGICGIVRRADMPGPEIGFAMLDAHAGCGYAQEAARASLALARRSLGLQKLYALARQGNVRSAGLLARLGFMPAAQRRPDGIAPDVDLFERSL